MPFNLMKKSANVDVFGALGLPLISQMKCSPGWKCLFIWAFHYIPQTMWMMYDMPIFDSIMLLKETTTHWRKSKLSIIVVCHGARLFWRILFYEWTRWYISGRMHLPATPEYIWIVIDGSYQIKWFDGDQVPHRICQVMELDTSSSGGRIYKQKNQWGWTVRFGWWFGMKYVHVYVKTICHEFFYY